MSGFFSSIYGSWSKSATEMAELVTEHTADLFNEEGFEEGFSFAPEVVQAREEIAEALDNIGDVEMAEIRYLPIESDEGFQLMGRIKSHIPNADVEGKLSEFMHDSELFEGRAGTFNYGDVEDLQEILDILDQSVWEEEMKAAEMEPSAFVRQGDDWLQRTAVDMDAPLEYTPPEWNPLEAQMGPGESGRGGVTFEQWKNTKRFAGTEQIDPGIDPGLDINLGGMGDTEAHLGLTEHEERLARTRDSIREFRENLARLREESEDSEFDSDYEFDDEEEELDDFLENEFGEGEDVFEEILEGEFDSVRKLPSKEFPDLDIVKVDNLGVEMQEYLVLDEPPISEVQDFVNGMGPGDIELQDLQPSRVALEGLGEAAQDLVESGLDLSAAGLDLLPTLGETLEFTAGIATGLLLGVAAQSLIESMGTIVSALSDTSWIKHPYDIHGMTPTEAKAWMAEMAYQKNPTYKVTRAITTYFNVNATYIWVFDDAKAMLPETVVDYFGKTRPIEYGHDTFISTHSAVFKGTNKWYRGRVMSATGTQAGYKKPNVEFEDDHELRYSLRLKSGEAKFFWIPGDATILEDNPLTKALCVRANKQIRETAETATSRRFPLLPPKLVNPFAEDDRWFAANNNDYAWDEYLGYQDMVVPEEYTDSNLTQLRKVYLGLLHGGYWGTPETTTEQRVANLHNILDPQAPINAPKKTRFDKWRDSTDGKRNPKRDLQDKLGRIEEDRDGSDYYADTESSSTYIFTDEDEGVEDTFFHSHDGEVQNLGRYYKDIGPGRKYIWQIHEGDRVLLEGNYYKGMVGWYEATADAEFLPFVADNGSTLYKIALARNRDGYKYNDGGGPEKNYKVRQARFPVNVIEDHVAIPTPSVSPTPSLISEQFTDDDPDIVQPIEPITPKFDGPVSFRRALVGGEPTFPEFARPSAEPKIPIPGCEQYELLFNVDEGDDDVGVTSFAPFFRYVAEKYVGNLQGPVAPNFVYNPDLKNEARTLSQFVTFDDDDGEEVEPWDEGAWENDPSLESFAVYGGHGPKFRETYRTDNHAWFKCKNTGDRRVINLFLDEIPVWTPRTIEEMGFFRGIQVFKGLEKIAVDRGLLENHESIAKDRMLAQTHALRRIFQGCPVDYDQNTHEPWIDRFFLAHVNNVYSPEQGTIFSLPAELNQIVTALKIEGYDDDENEDNVYITEMFTDYDELMVFLLGAEYERIKAELYDRFFPNRDNFAGVFLELLTGYIDSYPSPKKKLKASDWRTYVNATFHKALKDANEKTGNAVRMEDIIMNAKRSIDYKLVMDPNNPEDQLSARDFAEEFGVNLTYGPKNAKAGDNYVFLYQAWKAGNGAKFKASSVTKPAKKTPSAATVWPPTGETGQYTQIDPIMLGKYALARSLSYKNKLFRCPICRYGSDHKSDIVKHLDSANHIARTEVVLMKGKQKLGDNAIICWVPDKANKSPGEIMIEAGVPTPAPGIPPPAAVGPVKVEQDEEEKAAEPVPTHEKIEPKVFVVVHKDWRDQLVFFRGKVSRASSRVDYSKGNGLGLYEVDGNLINWNNYPPEEFVVGPRFKTITEMKDPLRVAEVIRTLNAEPAKFLGVDDPKPYVPKPGEPPGVPRPVRQVETLGVYNEATLGALAAGAQHNEPKVIEDLFTESEDDDGGEAAPPPLEDPDLEEEPILPAAPAAVPGPPRADPPFYVFEEPSSGKEAGKEAGSIVPLILGAVALATVAAVIS